MFSVVGKNLFPKVISLTKINNSQEEKKCLHAQEKKYSIALSNTAVIGALGTAVHIVFKIKLFITGCTKCIIKRFTILSLTNFPNV